MAFREIGHWDGRWAPDGLPDVCDFVDPAADPAEQRAVAAYLRSGTSVVVAMGFSVCRLCGRGNGNEELTDGAHFFWPSGLAHYVEEHAVRLPAEVVAVAARAVAPPVDLDRFKFEAWESGEIKVDLEWWKGQTGTRSGVHLLGCRRSAVVARWDLPATADIYVDRVPAGGVATLARIGRLVGAAWPASGLRALLATQPLLAAPGGSPARLHMALEAAPDLRPYLFYSTGDGLVPVRRPGSP
ncbi:hypothetical protein KZZ52_22785 [Dactylosporangium sp. AC04546]|uniref:hypothetical protein n=1 Tax=Dactylosporangium sp. AC04546 TaxID=2862460 RepID=UPI001EDE86B8|nr:hypothetical protein [Dactylosporangium sp. AC04546]WVK88105.1 hypothetical protein KZZ52_22785 [Dactylosporangium sp. AC04546]